MEYATASYYATVGVQIKDALSIRGITHPLHIPAMPCWHAHISTIPMVVSTIHDNIHGSSCIIPHCPMYMGFDVNYYTHVKYL
jgi:hypothetical protein